MDPRRRHQRGEVVGVEFPVAMRVIAGAFDLTLEPLTDDQELDARTSVGTIYWRGYLELIGYGAPLRLSPASSSVVSAIRRHQRENPTT